MPWWTNWTKRSLNRTTSLSNNKDDALVLYTHVEVDGLYTGTNGMLGGEMGRQGGKGCSVVEGIDTHVQAVHHTHCVRMECTARHVFDSHAIEQGLGWWRHREQPVHESCARLLTVDCENKTTFIFFIEDADALTKSDIKKYLVVLTLFTMMLNMHQCQNRDGKEYRKSVGETRVTEIWKECG